MSDNQGKLYSPWKICHHNLLCAYICRSCSFCNRPLTAAVRHSIWTQSKITLGNRLDWTAAKYKLLIDKKERVGRGQIQNTGSITPKDLPPKEVII